jgi:7-carboxy-7-deazaguanine synthase
MHFIRLAGCSVGKPFADMKERSEWATIRAEPVPQIYQEKCCTSLGEPFLCDTNFRSKEKKSIDDLLQEIGPVPRVCLTGGEPLMHDLAPLVFRLWKAGKTVHIETSGTILIPDYLIRPYGPVWIAVSPKTGVLAQAIMFANEIKILVGDSFDAGTFVQQYESRFDRVWLQPINEEFSINRTHLQRCLDLQQRFPELRISSQMHKVWGVR